jgi:hypothetical protein
MRRIFFVARERAERSSAAPCQMPKGRARDEPRTQLWISTRKARGVLGGAPGTERADVGAVTRPHRRAVRGHCPEEDTPRRPRAMDQKSRGFVYVLNASHSQDVIHGLNFGLDFGTLRSVYST